MKAFRGLYVRLTSAAALVAALTVLPVGGAMADPSDPICIMPPEDYCQYIEGHFVGTRAFQDCMRRAQQAQMNGECDWPAVAANISAPGTLRA